MSEIIYLVVFLLDEQRYALPLVSVGRVVPALEVTTLPNAPANVLGAINLQGEVIPVLNLRRRFKLPERDIYPQDHFLIAFIPQRTVALVIDEPQGVIEVDQSAFVSADQIVSDIEQLQGVVKLDDGLVLIHNLEKFLSLDEARVLDQALDRFES